MELREFLDPDEQVLWAGAPYRGLLFRGSDIFLIPFSLVWGGFALFWTAMVILSAFGALGASGAESFKATLIPFLLVGILFSIIGLFFIFGRFAVDIWRRKRTDYAVTNKRAIIINGFFGRSFDFMPLERSLQIKVSGKNRGSIRFGANYGFFDIARSLSYWIGPPHPFVFESIDDVQRVYGIIRNAQESSRG